MTISIDSTRYPGRRSAFKHFRKRSVLAVTRTMTETVGARGTD
jgi:hypothetical protein